MCALCTCAFVCEDKRPTVFMSFLEDYRVKYFLILPPRLQLCHMSDVYFNIYDTRLLITFIFITYTG